MLMDAEAFDQYTKYPEPRLVELAIPERYATFLAQTGLPTWCAPNIHFGELGESWTLLPVIEVGTKRYVGLGEDRDDNAIAMDLEDHSVRVVTATGQTEYLAGNVIELADALHRLQSCVNSAVENDPKAYSERRISPAFLQPFILWAGAQNPLAIHAGSFWHRVLAWLAESDHINDMFVRLRDAPP